MNRGISIVGFVVSGILALVGLWLSLVKLVTLADLPGLAYTIPAAVVGTTLCLYFAHEFLLTFPGLVNLLKLQEHISSAPPVDWDDEAFKHQAAIRRAQTMEELRMRKG